MDTFDIVVDVVWDETPWIVISADDLKTFKANADKTKDKKTREYLQAQAEHLTEQRKVNADNIKQVRVTVKRPSSEDRTEVRSASRDDNGIYDNTREPLAACRHLVQSWTKEGDKDPHTDDLPICLMDRVYGECYPMLYPSQARMAFFAPSVG